MSFDFQETKPAPKQKAASLPSIAAEEKKAEEVAKDAKKDKAEDTKVDKPKPKYNPDELLKIFDDIIFSGEYVEDVKIKGRLNISLRTRSAEQISSITSMLDSTPANLISTVTERRSLYQLTYALIKYQNTDLSTMKLEERENFIKKLPSPVVGALMMALSKFDDKVFEACKEGEENF